jgi:SAM-dependent methyltransferase
LLLPLARDGAAAVFGSRFLTRLGALRGGMPLYKFVGNRVLTWLQNRLLGTKLSEFHSGYRLYSVNALRHIPFERNSNGFHFDTEIIIQLVIANLPIAELPIPTFYGDEICRVNGIGYAWNVVKATVRARLQAWSLFYDRRYDCAPSSHPEYESKLWFPSPPSFAFNIISSGSSVIDLGAGTTLASALREIKHCRVIGVNESPIPSQYFESFYCRDLNKGLVDIPVESSDYILLLDVIEHLSSPEEFLDELRSRTPQGELIISSANVAFAITRLMLLIGQFNYGRRGILDLTHTRLFTLGSLIRLLEQSGFVVLEKRAMPAPFPLALGDGPMSRFLLKMNSILIRVAPKLFGYQVLVRAKALPTVVSLLEAADHTTSMKTQLLEAAV